MIIIFEGPDGCGKSTLIQQLHDQYGFPIFQSGGPKTIEQMDLKLNHLKTLANESNIYLCDRVPFISEIIYSRSFGREPIIPESELKKYWTLPMKIVYCSTNQAIALQNMVRTYKAHKPIEHLKMVEQNHEQIFIQYEKLMITLLAYPINILKYDWMHDHQHPYTLKGITTWIKM
jgi:hypothetical protein